MATVRDLLEEAQRIIGVISDGENISASGAANGLVKLNNMIDEWSADGFPIYASVREEFSFVAGQASYTMGPSANFNTTRPIVIQQVGAVQTTPTQLEVPIEVINVQKFSSIAIKSIQSTFPSYVYDAGGFPNLTLTFFPVPQTTNKVAIYSLKPLASFASINETVSLPQGYKKALVYNLAVEWAEDYGKSTTPKADKIAVDSKATISRANFEPTTLVSDYFGLSNRGGYNIYSGGFNNES